MDLRGGSLLRADGGFLVMYALDALTETGVWRTLKRTLNHGKLEIQPRGRVFPVQHCGAEARADRRAREDHSDRRPRHVRTALRLRGRLQKDFQGARRIRRRNEDGATKSCASTAAACASFPTTKSSVPFDRTAVAGDSGARRAPWRAAAAKSRRDFSILPTWRAKSSYVARSEERAVVTAAHVRQALRSARSSATTCTETKIREMIEQNLLFIDTTARASAR